ncbi:hypothetical protein AOLI_G00286620, partial [Acnodon oligacanthus]
MTMSGQRGLTSITLEEGETMSSWMPFVSIIEHVCAALHRPWMLVLQTGSQHAGLERGCTLTLPWDSGVSMQSSLQERTAPITQFGSSAQE